MSSSPKITYWFGAGASYHSVPIQKKLTQSMYDFADYLESLPSRDSYFDHKNPLYNDRAHLSTLIKEYCKRAFEYGTIDTVARKLWFSFADNDLDVLKFCVDSYFSWWHYRTITNPKAIPYLNNDKKEQYESIDHRYFGLLAILLNRNNSQWAHQLDKNINFLTYNYDLQLECAICELSGITFDTGFFLENLNTGMLPKDSKDFKNRQIIHLNGHSAFHLNKNGELSPNFRQQNLQTEKTFYATLIKQFRERNENNIGKDISYAWEMDDDKLKRSREILSEIDHLVIVGYSFPAFNRRIDLELLTNLKSSAKVTLQDCNPQEEALHSILPEDIPRENIKLKKQVEQFFIPPEIFGVRKEITYNGPKLR